MHLLRSPLLAWALAVAAWGGSVSFTFPVKSGEKTVETKTVEVNRVSYVSLTGLVSQAGGDCSVVDTRIEVNFAGGAASIARGSLEVNASSGRFSLRHPPLVNDKSVLIALSDVVPFFGNAFRTSVTQRVAEGNASDDAPEQEPPPELSPSESKPAVNEAVNNAVRLVVIDPGHGGNDAGAVGAAGIKEKDVALGIARRLDEVLRTTHGMQTLLTRKEDVALSVEKRVSAANVKRGTLLVSIHAAASLAPTTTGIAVFYGGESLKSAPGTPSALGEAVAAALAASTSTHVRGVHPAACRVFTGLRMPGIQVEAGAITTPGEESLLADGGYQQKIAEGIAKGIMQYASGGQ